MPGDKNVSISQIRIAFMCYSLIQYTEAEIYCMFQLQKEKISDFCGGGKFARAYFLTADKV
jgi:hypothetical protein